VEHGCGSYFGSEEKNPTVMGSRGLVPLGCLPLWGREGVTLAISTPAQKTKKGFLIEPKKYIPFIGIFCHLLPLYSVRTLVPGAAVTPFVFCEAVSDYTR
jgi:hypothetical protein